MASDSRGMIDSSAVVDMDVIGSDESDYEVDLSAKGQLGHHGDDHNEEDSHSHPQSREGLSENVKRQVGQGVASFSTWEDPVEGNNEQEQEAEPPWWMSKAPPIATPELHRMWEEGRQRATKAFGLYANIDVFRPYFDVEPHQVRTRLLHSLVPRKPSTGSNIEKVPRELYGPTMILFTLIAILLFQMKTSGHVVQEGTLMGSAFGVCFGYWLGVSSFVWFLAYVCNTHITMMQIMSLLGYALFSHCLVLLTGTVFHPTHSHMFFYLLWVTLGGLSTLKMMSILLSRTAGKSQQLIICSVVATMHLLFLLYLHFAYHTTVEEISAVLDNRVVPQPLSSQVDVGPANLAPDTMPKEMGSVVGEHALPSVKAQAMLGEVEQNIKQVVREAITSRVGAANELSDVALAQKHAGDTNATLLGSLGHRLDPAGKLLNSSKLL